MADRSNKEKGIKVIQVDQKDPDPEAGRYERVKKEEERLRIDLRKDSKVKTIEGSHRAHKVSLKLAVELWRIIKGQKVNSHEETLLTELLREKVNIYHTCTHTNQVDHVKYDNEIIYALKQKQNGNIKTRLTPGSKIRLKQILNTLNKLKAHSPELSDFCIKSVKLLRAI